MHFLAECIHHKFGKGTVNANWETIVKKCLDKGNPKKQIKKEIHSGADKEN